MTTGLAALISPMSEECFLAEYWERAVLHVANGRGRQFPFARSPLWLEEKIGLFCQSWGDVSLARAGTDPADCPYLTAPPDVATIERAFAENYTVVINDMQKKDMEIARLCRAMERDLFCRANVNLYLTNRNGQGLAYHYDDDDVFILQLRGEKTWRIYEKRAELPLAGARYDCPDCTDTPFRAYALKEGDVFYVPRGFVHEAVTADSVSLHLTISLAVVRWAQFFRELVSVAAENAVELRRAVPASLLRRGAMRNGAVPDAALMKQLGDPALLQEALARVQDGVLDGVARLPSRDLSVAVEAQAIGPGTLVAINADQLCCLAPMAGGFVLKGAGARIEFTGALAPLAAALFARETFRARDLPESVPLETRLDIVRRLVENGFLVELR